MKYKNLKQVIINNVDKEDKIQLKNINIDFKLLQQPDSIYINESGLYSLLIKWWYQLSNTYSIIDKQFIKTNK